MQPTSSGQSGPLQDTSIVYLQPLHDRQIRVLALQPGSGDDPLACQLHVVEVDVKVKNLSFEAISYVWGTRGTTESITCKAGNDGAQFNLPITRNATDALKAFRQPQDERLLWIDSICISQTSQSEKSTQVAMMDSIFASATAVLIWLGDEDAVPSPAAGALFERWAAWYQHATAEEKQETLSRGNTLTTFSKPMPSSSAEVETIIKIFECRWFWRLWCVQELVLAEKALVCWGSARLTWETIFDLAVHVQAWYPWEVVQSGLAGVQNVHLLQRLRSQVKGETTDPLAFSRLLSLTRAHGVTEQHDRIFSLLGLDRKMRSVTPADMDPEDLFVTPDYSRDIEEVYLSVAQKLLIREGNLHLLSFVQHGDEVATGSLPSWVPQWRNIHTLITQFDLLSCHPVNIALGASWGQSDALEAKWRRNIALITALESNADGSSIPASSPDASSPDGSGQSFHIVNESALQVKGLLPDTVSKKCDDPTSTSEPGARWGQILRRWFWNVVVWLEPEFCGPEPGVFSDELLDVAFRVFYRTLFGGHLNIKEVFTTLQNELPAFRDLLCSADGEDFSSFPITKELMIPMCHSRTLFCTAGRRVGIGPRCLQPGDSICFLFGAAVPLLMRPHPQDPLQWLLVGETYVNGLAYVSNDYEVSKKFEALRIVAPRELRNPIVSKPRDPEWSMYWRMHLQGSFSVWVETLRSCTSGKSTTPYRPSRRGTNCCPTGDEILQDFVESSASAVRVDGQVEVPMPRYGIPEVFLIR
jgi:hypothetical protein